MTPSFRAFTEELMLMKTAQNPSSDTDLKKFLVNFGKAALGAAAGGAAYGLVHHALKKNLPKMLPRNQKLLSATAAALAGIGGLAMAAGTQKGFATQRKNNGN